MGVGLRIHDGDLCSRITGTACAARDPGAQERPYLDVVAGNEYPMT
jgi:hypothetical protein